MTAAAGAGILLPAAIGLVWMIVIKDPKSTGIRARLIWAAASVIGVIVVASLAADAFSQPTTDRDLLSGAVSFAPLEGMLLAGSAAVSVLVLTALLFLSGPPRPFASTDDPKEPRSEEDALRMLGDDW
ncbi:hypothetical protein C5C33_14235 [Rathayibacter sp. AY1H3]|nr:hypothetical protein C5C33_14235 [Rathayibacter sp. AY1H3]